MTERTWYGFRLTFWPGAWAVLHCPCGDGYIGRPGTNAKRPGRMAWVRRHWPCVEARHRAGV